MYKGIYEKWLENPYFDEKTKEELRAIKNNPDEIKERFYSDLEFGTAGIRGIIGAGRNRMNIYTVRKATQGLANYIIKQKAENKGVAIAYDSRRMSPEFADEAALCLCANGIKAYVFESLRPTPELSFTVRNLGCIAGINVTASHNPPEYNGYKVYWEDGAQITPPHDTGIMAEVNAVNDFSLVKTITKEEALQKGLYKIIGKEIDDKYIEALKSLVLDKESIDKYGKEIKIVYSPLHGTGNIPVRRVLKELGFENVYVVKEQELPDGEFPTVSYPNPEAEEAFTLGLKLANEVDADLILATDPDADRLGVYLRKEQGKYIALTGNVSGCILAEYEIRLRSEKNMLPEDGTLIKTIVTSNLADAIAEYYKINLIEVLTGFKYIGEKILEFEKSGKGTFIFGFEESYGCLVGTHARDKDAIVASMVLCEAVAHFKSLGKTLLDVLAEMYERYGYYQDSVKAITLKGIDGLAKIKLIMKELSNQMPDQIGSFKVIGKKNYNNGTVKGFPKSNVLYFELNDSAWLCVRPSGTEPKIKFYYEVKGKTAVEAEEKSQDLKKGVEDLVNKYL